MIKLDEGVIRVPPGKRRWVAVMTFNIPEDGEPQVLCHQFDPDEIGKSESVEESAMQLVRTIKCSFVSRGE